MSSYLREISRRHQAFSLVEALTGLIVIALIIGSMSMKSGASRQSIRREAERIAAYINSLIQEADKNRNPFTITFGQNTFMINWAFKKRNGEYSSSFNRNRKYIISSNVTEYKYSIKNNNFTQGGTMTLTEITPEDIPDKNKYYVIIAVIGGRVRTSDNPPKTK